MGLTQYIHLLRRWFWLLLLAAFVGGAASFVVRSSSPPIYAASATVIIGNSVSDPDPNSAEIRTAQDLTQTYAQLVRTFDVRQAVVDALTLDLSAQDLGERISVRILPGTSLLVIDVRYNDPVLSADIANALAQQLILTSPTNLTEDQQAQVDVANAQIDELADEITDLRQQLQAVNESLSTTSGDTAALNDRRLNLIDQINQTSANIAQFTNIVASLQQRTNSVEIVESARIPTQTTGISLALATLLGAVAAGAVAFGGVLVLEYLNDTVRTTAEATYIMEMPVLGVISPIGKKGKQQRGGERLILNLPPFSRNTEEYHTLRANLLFTLSQTSEETHTLVITSPSPQEGKSTTAANLAISLAFAGKRVLLVDADLRRPRQHEIFDLPNETGLTSMLAAHTLAATPAERGSDDNHLALMREVMHATPVKGLRVITSGYVPRNPNEILGSGLMRRWGEVFRVFQGVDFVIFDSPPSLSVSDSAVLASNINAHVLIVLDAGNTRQAAATRTRERFQHLSERVLGIVLNNADLRGEDYYGYDYDYYYTDAPPAGGPNAN